MVNAVLEFVHGETLLLLSRSKMYASSSCIKPPNHGMFALPIVIFLVNSGCILFFEGNKPDCCSVSPNSSSCLEDRVYRPILVHQWIWRVPKPPSVVFSTVRQTRSSSPGTGCNACQVQNRTRGGIWSDGLCKCYLRIYECNCCLYATTYPGWNPPRKETFIYWCV